MRLAGVLERDPPLMRFYEDTSWFAHFLKYVDLQTHIERHVERIVTENYISESATIEQNTVVRQPVVILDNAKVLSGSYIEGPSLVGENTVTGPHCYIRKNSIVLSNVRIGYGAEIKASIISDNCRITHFSYVGNSILGRNVNIGAGTVTSVRRFDNKNVHLKIMGKLYDTKKRKFGAIIGDNVQTGVGVVVYPGRIIKPSAEIDPGEKVINNLL